jgi:N-methylhydantoinase A
MVAALPVEILTWRVAVATRPQPVAPLPEPAAGRLVTPALQRAVLDPASGLAQCFGQVRRADLRPGDRIAGPALIVEDETTTVVSPAFDAAIDAHGYIVMTRRPPGETLSAPAVSGETP